jgi:hypothetical protein
MSMAKKKVNVKENYPYVLPALNGELTIFVDKYKLDMMEQVVSSIEYALENKLPITEVFQFKNSQFVVTIAEKEFESNLDNIYRSYMEKEIYELCPRVVKLQNLLKRNKDEKQKETKSRSSGSTKQSTN